MRDFFYTFLLVISGLTCSAQDIPLKLNLNFEQEVSMNQLPKGWMKWGLYNISKDTTVKQDGRISARIISDTSKGSFGCVAYKIPAYYTGDSIRLTGWMKIKDANSGYCGLFLRIDDANGKPIVFDNMARQKIQGTIGWKQYSITLPYPEDAITIVVAGIIIGEGTAWFDNFDLQLDGKDIQTITPKIPKASLDKEFDNDSKFRIDKLSKLQIVNLYKLAKVWGFLKYHHPKIAKGDYNWDYELFRILPSININNFNAKLLEWVKSLGPIQRSSKQKKKKYEIKIASNTQWINDHKLLGKELSTTLQNIKAGDRKPNNYYLGYEYSGNAKFKNENAYLNMKSEDDGYRILSLFKYWNMIEYYFPYKNLLDKNWDSILQEYIPKIIQTDDELSYKLGMLKLIGEIDDTHANIWSDKTLKKYFGENFIPLRIKFIQDKAVVTEILDGFPTTSNIKVGSVITKINSLPIEKVVSKLLEYCPASNYSTKLRIAASKLLRTNLTEQRINYTDGNERFEEKIKTIPYNYKLYWNTQPPAHKVIGNNIGYIYPGSLKKGTVQGIMKSFLKMDGLIIDLRCYPSDFIPYSLGKMLVPKTTPFALMSNPNREHPGQFFLEDEPLKIGKKNPEFYKGEVIIIVNEETQSQAEFIAMAFRTAPKATVIGSTTAGADGNVSSIILPGNIKTSISGLGVYYPDKRETQQVGIVPDIFITPTINGIRAEKDELLEQAIEIINKKSRKSK